MSDGRANALSFPPLATPMVVWPENCSGYMVDYAWCKKVASGQELKKARMKRCEIKLGTQGLHKIKIFSNDDKAPKRSFLSECMF